MFGSLVWNASFTEIPPFGPSFEAGELGQPDVRAHSEGAHHQVGTEEAAVRESHLALTDLCHRDADLYGDTVRAKLVGHEHGELGVEGSKDLRCRLDDRDGDPGAREVLGGLEADEAGTDHDGRTGMHGDV